jgi:hypothetical protein
MQSKNGSWKDRMRQIGKDQQRESVTTAMKGDEPFQKRSFLTAFM